MTDAWKHLLRRWTDAGLIDAAAADRIRAFEEQRTGTARLQWPIWIALAFGAVMLGAGVLLLVSAYWDEWPPAGRFSVALLLVALFHAAAASTQLLWFATTLRALGTVALGAGIFLTGQIFHLEAHWPAGLMLWAIGAAAAWVLLREWPQLAIAAVLVPAWLLAEWASSLGPRAPFGAMRVTAAGVFLLALVYFTAPAEGRATGSRRVLWWLGAIALPPAAIMLGTMSAYSPDPQVAREAVLSVTQWGIGWVIAFCAPVVVAARLHQTRAWPHVLAALWVAGEVNIHAHLGTWMLFGWWAMGAVALAAWGVRDGRTERVNMASAIFAATVLAFYFSQVMDRLGRSTSLIGLGVLFLAGGWALERARRHLVQTTRGART
jgi:hypothetical protein